MKRTRAIAAIPVAILGWTFTLTGVVACAIGAQIIALAELIGGEK